MTERLTPEREREQNAVVDELRQMAKRLAVWDDKGRPLHHWTTVAEDAAATLDEYVQEVANLRAHLITLHETVPTKVADALMQRTHAASGQAIFVDAEIIRSIVATALEQ